MTCIVGLEHDGVVYIGGDSFGSNGFTGQPTRRPKVFEKDGFLFGYCGSFKLGQILEFKLTIPKRFMGEKVEDYVYNRLADEIKSCLEIHKCIEVKDGVPKILGGSDFLFGYEGGLYCVQNDLSILQNKCGYDAAGSGAYHAMSSVYSTKDLSLSPEDRITRAIECANNFVVSVNDEITILRTKKNESEYICSQPPAVPVERDTKGL